MISTNDIGFMLDTSALNKAGHVAQSTFDGHRVFVTHVQRDELGRTKDLAVRARLMMTFADIGAASLATTTSVWDDTTWDEGCWSPEDGVYERLLKRLAELDAASRKRPRDPMNQSRDVRIAETAIQRHLTLVTDDRNLAKVMMEFGGRALTFDQFCALK
jgi:hypothetical protein